MPGNISELFVKCMRQVTNGHLYHLLGVLDYYVMYRQRPSQFITHEKERMCLPRFVMSVM